MAEAARPSREDRVRLHQGEWYPVSSDPDRVRVVSEEASQADRAEVVEAMVAEATMMAFHTALPLTTHLAPAAMARAVLITM